MNDRPQTSPDLLVRELQRALEAAIEATREQDQRLACVRNGRARFLRKLAELLEPAFDVLADQRTGLAAFPDQGLYLGAGKVWRYCQEFPDEQHRDFLSGPLSDQELGELRIDPVDLLRSIVAILGAHARGRGRSSEELQAESRRFSALLALIDGSVVVRQRVP